MWCGGPVGPGGDSGEEVFPGPLPQGMCRTSLCRDLRALGSRGASTHGCQAWAGEDWSTRAQSIQQEGEQLVLGLQVSSGLTGPWSDPHGVNRYFLPPGFPLSKHQADHLVGDVPLPIPSGFIHS